MELVIFIAIALILIFILIYRKNAGQNVYKYIVTGASNVYNKYAPYSYKKVREKVKELGQDYTPKQYTTQVLIFAVGAFGVSYLYFYNILRLL